MGRQHAHASTPKGFEPLRAEPNGFLVHLLSHSDTVSSAGAPHWLLKHAQSTFCPSAKEANDERGLIAKLAALHPMAFTAHVLNIL